MIRPDTNPGCAADTPLRVVLTCGNPACRHTFEPDLDAFAEGRLGCPRCHGWTFHAALVEPGSPAGGGLR